jgi:tetratricopeptide (TPR) repeat protein
VIPVLRHTAQKVCAALAPDGRHVVTATEAGTVYVLAIDREGRDVADLERLSEVLTGQQLDPLLGPMALSAEALLEKWKAVRDQWPKDLTVSPRDVAIWHSLQADLCARQQMWSGVLFHLSELVAIEPDNPRHRLNRAKIYLSHKRVAEALADLSKANQLEPKDLEAAELLAQAYTQLNKPAEAITAYAKAIALMELDDKESRSHRRQAFAARAALLKQEHRFKEALVDQLHSLGIPLRQDCAAPTQIDLSAFYNFSFSDDLHGIKGNNLLPLPTGCATLAGVKFDLRGIVQVANQGLLEKTCPMRCDGILIDQKCHALHFLQGAAWGGAVEWGTTIGRYVAHFADGSEQIIPIRFGQDVLDWWQTAGAGAAPTEAEVVWSSQNKVSGISLFERTWRNPFPELRITTIDFVSAMTPAAPFLIAISSE